jgi:hypothetical protein
VKEAPASAFPESVLYDITGNELLVLSKEVSVCYRGHMLQLAGYQEILYSLSRGTTHEKHIFTITIKEVRITRAQAWVHTGIILFSSQFRKEVLTIQLS